MTQTHSVRRLAPALRRPNRPATPTSNLPLLVLGALGVVYGDIGTSPLYAFREALHAAGRRASATETCSGCCR